LVACGDDDSNNGGQVTQPEAGMPVAPPTWDDAIVSNNSTLFEAGRRVFRDDTFGSEQFFGDQLKLHQAILGEALGGVGPGLSARTALALGLKVDVARLPQAVIDALAAGTVDLDSPATTLELLRANAVIGVVGIFDANRTMVSVGITCSFCHATVDNSLTAGIGQRLDAWPNRDLDVGAIVALSPDLSPYQQLLGVPRSTVVTVLTSWGPGKFDAQLNFDGKAFQPDGRSAATVIPAAFGLVGQNLHTYTGFGSVPYWNAYVANTQMRGLGTFVDRRLTPDQYPLVRATGFNNKRDSVDLITGKLGSLHYYQLSIPAPTPPEGSFDPGAAQRGQAVFNGVAQCATCHVPPLFSEPGFAMHTGAEIGIDDFQANRSPERMYRTTPLRGLFTRAKPGFYHDGRFPTLDAVVDHYAARFAFTLTAQQKTDLIEYLKSL
jgi:hypothetical protein